MHIFFTCSLKHSTVLFSCHCALMCAKNMGSTPLHVQGKCMHVSTPINHGWTSLAAGASDKKAIFLLVTECKHSYSFLQILCRYITRLRNFNLEKELAVGSDKEGRNLCWRDACTVQHWAKSTILPLDPILRPEIAWADHNPDPFTCSMPTAWSFERFSCLLFTVKLVR